MCHFPCVTCCKNYALLLLVAGIICTLYLQLYYINYILFQQAIGLIFEFFGVMIIMMKHLLWQHKFCRLENFLEAKSLFIP